ncbi:MAG TPA: EF-P lysine aminoacylase GenX [Desulfobulbus sp.]|nr:EF-P lysine aminoacylase GenX [Desulfobulbus sp.]
MLSPAGLKQRSDFLQSLRLFFREREYLEVDTPIRLPVLLPESEIVPYASENCWLQTSPELCMKRLLARGATRLFQICHCFRKEEQGRLHAPEFTMLEWYHVGWNYLDLMQECEELIVALAAACSAFTGIAANGKNILRNKKKVLLTPPWDRLSVDEAFAAYTDTTAGKALAEGRFDEFLVTEIEPHLGWDRPLFLYDYPVRLGSLARPKPGAPHLAERFELYCCGIELANGFSELVDAEEQRLRFSRELASVQGHVQREKMPESFLQDLARLGDTAGIACGVDRLLMLFSGASCLDDVLVFSRDELY